MNKNKMKVLSVCLCTALIAGGAGAAYAAAGGNASDSDAVRTEESADYAGNENDGEGTVKDETVYVMADADGSVNKIIVSDWIKNEIKADSVTDSSALQNIENIKGNETYSVNGENMKVWDTEGKDIYYQGDIEKELPVALSVSYKLDGKPVSKDELAGKSGRVTIRFDYDNRQYEMKKINGRTEKIYVPFVMLTGITLDNQVFSNVQVSNGKLINDGDRTAVAGLAFPGLADNLKLGSYGNDIPSYVEITADAKDFKLGMTVTVASNELFSEVDTAQIGSGKGLSESLEKLDDAMGQLLDGSSALYDGMSVLLDKSAELAEGINQLAEGAQAIKDGAGSVDEGTARLKSGLEELSTGLDTITANNDKLNGGAKQVFETLLQTATAQLKAAGVAVPALTPENYEKTLNKVIASLDKNAVYNKALEQVSAAVNEKRPMITQMVTETVRSQVEKKTAEAVKESVAKEVQEAIDGGILDASVKDAVIAEKLQSDEIKTVMSEKVKESMASAEVKKMIEDNVNIQIQKAVSENMASTEVQSKLNAASEGAKSVISLKASLDSYNSFYLGLMAYTDSVSTAAAGAAKLNSGASDLKNGTAQLKNGAAALYDGIFQLKEGVPALIDGVSQLKDGSMQLSDGMQRFNEEGIGRMTKALDVDLGSLAARVKATADVSADYRNFSGINSGMDGKVRFIYRTDEIEKEKAAE